MPDPGLRDHRAAVSDITPAEVDCVVEGADCVVFDFHLTLSSDLFFTPLGESTMAEIERLFWCPDQPLQHQWMAGDVSAAQVAEYLSRHLGISADTIEAALRQGCRRFTLHRATWAFARSAHAAGKRTALVTVNADVFSQEIVPAHGLDGLFDVIVNSADHGTTDKRRLWPVAFDMLGDGASYTNGFLIEDGEQSPAHFVAAGGKAYQYHGDDAFAEWIRGRCEGVSASPAPM